LVTISHDYKLTGFIFQLFVNTVLPTTRGWKDLNCWALYVVTQKDTATEVQERWDRQMRRIVM